MRGNPIHKPIKISIPANPLFPGFQKAIKSV